MSFQLQDQITTDMLQYKNKISPYEGMRLYGRVNQTYLRGHKVYDYQTGFNTPLGWLL